MSLKIFEAGIYGGNMAYHREVNDRLACVRRCQDVALLLEVYDAPEEAHIQKSVRFAAYSRVRKLLQREEAI